MKKYLLTLFITLGLAAAIMFSVMTLRTQVAPLPQPVTTPTKPISTHHAVGGTVDTSTPKTAPTGSTSPAAAAQPEAAPATPSTSSPITIAPEDSSRIAPAQFAIKRSVSQEYPYRALGVTPNDPAYTNNANGSNWTLQTTNTPTAWNTTTGNANVVIAVIDTGFALQHEDLASQWRTNSGEIGQTTLRYDAALAPTSTRADKCTTDTSGKTYDKTTNGCDDDTNGYADDWRGWNFVGNNCTTNPTTHATSCIPNNNPQAGNNNPSGQAVSHGTEVAGLAGAAGNNGKGIVAASWNVRLMPLMALNDDGTGYTSDIVAAVRYAADNGATVISMSLGGAQRDPALSAAIAYATSKNIPVVAAAGNCGTGQEQGCDPAQPGAMGYPGLDRSVISVGATDSSNVRASFSSFGPGLDIMAPGSGNLISTMWQSGDQTAAYASPLYGTSFATPQVASVLGLLKTIRPNSSIRDIVALIDATATKPATMNGQAFSDQYGHGIVNAGAAISTALALNTTPTTPTLLQTGGSVSEHTFLASEPMGSGCTIAGTLPCTIWMQDTNGYDRYLPYQTANQQTGWSWNSSMLTTPGPWTLRAESGDQISATPYDLLRK